MEEEFLVIAVTPPYEYPGEAERINDMIANRTVNFVHIRKPDYSAAEIEKLINGIEHKFHPHLKLHDHFELIDKYNLGGVHLNSRNTITPKGAATVSKSFHSLEELEDVDTFEYFFISPIFDSISKSGYKSHFDLDTLSKKIKGKKAIALGGVTPLKFDYLKSIGFKGGALLGYFFP